MNQLKILIVGDAVFNDRAGGGVRYMCEVAKRLSCHHQVYLLVQRHNTNTPDYELFNNIHIYRFGNKNSSIISRIKSAKRIFEDLSNKIKFDIINIHFALGGFGIILSKKSKNIPKLFTFQGPWAYELLTENKRRQKYFLKTQLVFLITYLIERATIRSCDSFLVLSQFSKNLLAKTYQIPKSKITIIPAGIDINKFCPTQNKQLVRRQLNLPHNIPILFTIRRLVARMGLENLIEAMSLVTKERNVLLIIGGKGYLEAQLKKLISKYRLEEHVKLIGYIPDDTLPLYYQAADLFVLPTVAYEGFGLVTLEALSCGIPAIGTKVGGTVEILEKFDNKLLVSSNNPKNLAQGIIATLVRKDLNSSRCRQFVIENYCWDGIFQQIENFFIGVKNEHHVHQPYIYNKWCRGKYA